MLPLATDVKVLAANEIKSAKQACELTRIGIAFAVDERKTMNISLRWMFEAQCVPATMSAARKMNKRCTVRVRVRVLNFFKHKKKRKKSIKKKEYCGKLFLLLILVGFFARCLNAGELLVDRLRCGLLQKNWQIANSIEHIEGL